LCAALQDYEVVGLSTNIEFLKKICKSPGFMRGEVETGYIQKNHDDLFAPEVIEPETFAQAALGLLAKELSLAGTSTGPHGQTIGFGAGASIQRQFAFITTKDSSPEPVQVNITQSGRNLFDIEIAGPGVHEAYANVICEPRSPSISSFFPHTRIESTIITDGDKLTIFQHGKQTKLTLATPGWFEKALGLKDVTNSVLAPMPCKVLRNEVKEGDEVEKDQALVV